ncbi:MAG: type II secretion system protein [Candidatus Goldbacteria bacterium]|nr:type II secretion system protein [Candidatus Goldiibacteriota bacterium]
MRLKNNGFTLIELMVVVGIMGLLVAVAVPKFGQMLEKANLGATLGNLSAIRGAVHIYYGNNTFFPENLNEDEPWIKEMIGNQLPAVKCAFPLNASPRGNQVTLGNSIPATQGKGWYYDYGNGWIYINSTAKDIKGINYTVY